MKKQIKIIIITIFTTILLIVVFFQFYSTKIDNNSNSKLGKSDTLNYFKYIKDSVDYLYNFTNKNAQYKLSFLEFGSTTCHECKLMEGVMKEVKEKYNNVKVVFYNVRNKENKNMVNYFGIQMIPVQILLDKNGNECFRHLGYYSTDSLQIELKKYLN